MDKSFLEEVYGSEDYSDCSFIFPNEEGKVIKGHRVILAAALQTFRELFKDVQNHRNESCVIEIKDVKSTAFKNFLRFVYCKTIDLSFGELVELYEVSSKYNYDIGKSYLKEVFCKEKPTNFNEQNFIQLLEFASANNDQSLLELISKKLFIEHDFHKNSRRVSASLFIKAISCLNSDETLKEQPMKLLSIIEGFFKTLSDGGRILDETLEAFCWEKAKLTDVLTSTFLNEDKKVKFLIRSTEVNSTKNEIKPKPQDFRQYQYQPSYNSLYPEPCYNQSKKLKNSAPEQQTFHHKMVNNSVAKIGSLYTTQNHTDCTFVFPNDKTLKAHKFTLSLASPVFEAMFYGDLKEEDSVEIGDVEEPVFHLFLKIIYLIDVDLAVESSRTIYNLYAVAHKYQCLDALNLIRANINTRPLDAFLFYELSQLYADKAIEQECLENLKDPLCALDTDFFLDASPQSICTVYKANTDNTVSGTKKLIEKLEQYIEVNKQNNPQIESQIQTAFKGIRFAELEIIDILKTSLLASNEKVIMVAVKLNIVNPRKFYQLCLFKFSSYDQKIFNRGIELLWWADFNFNC